MPRFAYTAIDSRRKKAKGTVTAESSYAARKHLRSKGLHPTDVKELNASSESVKMGLVFRKGNKKLVAEFTRQLSTMLNAGIKLTEALGVLIPQIPDVRLRNGIADVRDRVVSGESFADALSEYGDFFDVIFISMIRVGEVTGTLSSGLETMANFMEKRRKIQSKMTTAMVYPICLLVVCMAVVIFLTVFLIPRIAGQMTKAGQSLPFITKILVNASEILMNPWWLMAIASTIFAASFATRRFLQTARGAYLKDRMLLSLPIFGPLLKQRIVARFTSTLSTLLGSGLSMAESLRIVAEVTGNTIMNRAVKQARERILSGADIATPLRESGVIDPTLAHMVTVGEKSGELDKMLMQISENLESSSDVVIDRISAAIEPVIIIVMAFLVGFITLAAFLPIFKYSSGEL